jgi:hypothetical protein
MKYVNVIFWDNCFPTMTFDWKPNNYMLCISLVDVFINLVFWFANSSIWILLLITLIAILESITKRIICQLYLICFSQMQIVPLLETTTILLKKLALNSELFVSTYSSEDVNLWWKACCWRRQSNRWLEICMHLQFQNFVLEKTNQQWSVGYVVFQFAIWFIACFV